MFPVSIPIGNCIFFLTKSELVKEANLKYKMTFMTWSAY